MGFKLNGRHSDEFGFAVTLKSISLAPRKRQKTVEVQGRDGQYIFDDGSYDNIQIEYACAIGDYDPLARRKKAREISAWVSTTGYLINDSEPDVEYHVVKCPNDITASVIGREYRDEFSIIFECDPHPTQVFRNDGLTWGDIDSSWPYMNLPWNGYERRFDVIDGQTITVYNTLTYAAIPIINLTGVASTVTVGPFTLINLSGTVYVDCKNMVVYSLEDNHKLNRIRDFVGSFPKLLPGPNEFLVTGSITNLTIEFDYKNTYL